MSRCFLLCVVLGGLALLPTGVSAQILPIQGVDLTSVQHAAHLASDSFEVQPRDDNAPLVVNGTAREYSIPDIQGSGFLSPVRGELVSTSGIVTGFLEGNLPGGGVFDAVFLQDASGDGLPATSDGLMVVYPDISLSGLLIGTTLEVVGVVQELSEWDGLGCLQGCMTTLLATWLSDMGGSTTLTPVILEPLQDTDVQNDYLEALEGMLVEMDGHGTVVAPTNFGTVAVLADHPGVTQVLRNSEQHGKTVGVRHYELFGDISGADPPSLMVGSTVDNLVGPLATSYGDYVIVTQGRSPWTQVSTIAPPETPSFWPEPQAGQLSAVTLNVEELDQGDARILKIVSSLVGLGCPTFVALQEVDTAGTGVGDSTEAITALLVNLQSEGCVYSSYNSHPDVGDHGVGVLWRTDQVTRAVGRADVQGCSVVGSQGAEGYDSHCAAFADQFPLFSRRPVIVETKVDAGCGGGETLDVTVIGLHLDSNGGGAVSDQRRLEQAQMVASVVDSLITGGSKRILVLGDLNDFEDSPVLQALTASGNLTNLWSTIPESDRFSYNHGGVLQALDHVLYTVAMAKDLLAGAPLHFNTPFPYLPFGTDPAVVWRASDHDPVAATFSACP